MLEEEEEPDFFDSDGRYQSAYSPKSQPQSPKGTKNYNDVQPPAQLKRLLELTREVKQENGNLFNEFLQSAKQALDTVKLLQIPIEASYKLISGLPPEKAVDEDKNDTLCLIFDFYARIRHNNSSKSFSDTLLSFQTMNFTKLEVFCRDFEIIPKLLTREDVKILWEDIGREHVAKGLGIFTVINFPEFKDLIVRMALWSYYKPGLKKLILTVEGFLPKPVEIVNCFCTYLKLYDDDYIHNFLRTVGRKTQGDYNYRSKDETNLRTKLEVRIDTNARSLKQVARKAPTAAAAAASSRPGTTNGKKAVGSLNSSQKIDEYGDVVKFKVDISPANPNNVISATRPIFDVIKRLHTSPMKPRIAFSSEMNDRFEALRSNPTKITTQHLTASETGGEGGERDFGNALDSHRSDITNQVTNPSNVRGNDIPKGKTRKGKGVAYSFQPEVSFAERDVDSGDEEDDPNGQNERGGSNFDLSSSITSIHPENSLEALREIFETNYDPRLVVELAKYTYVPPRAIVVDWIPSHGPLVDLGLLEGGMKVTINYRVVNETPDDILIDATTKNFGAEDTDVKMFSKPLIPGLSRIVTVNFTVPYQTMVVLGSLDILTINVRNRIHSTIRCPIFYYVDRSLEKPIYPNVNARALPDLYLQRFRLTNSPSDITRRRIPTNFQTKLSNDGTWSFTNKFAAQSRPQTGRDFILIKPTTS